MLNFQQIHILKTLYNNNQITENELKENFNININDKIITALRDDKLIFTDSSRLYQPKILFLTELGKAHVEQHDKDIREKHFQHFHIRVNTVLALLALFTAIPALILSIMQLLQQ